MFRPLANLDVKIRSSYDYIIVLNSGDIPRVDGQLAVARAFGDKSLKKHLSSEPDVSLEIVDEDTEFVILASDGIWKVMTNQEAVECIRNIKDAKAAAKHLVDSKY
ncbi:hypothetical protein CsSME_00046613 [Camellia sinensis var. sinensis]